jgi:hypothetical protein
MAGTKKKIDIEETAWKDKKKSSDREWDWKDFEWGGCDEYWSADGD